ncbi:hypothetical protein HY844_02675 [Candidatus Berkelbacteria bacterium]|nr:hypothetical protein [Candidatus Berkelbacteria bacterium]
MVEKRGDIPQGVEQNSTEPLISDAEVYKATHPTIEQPIETVGATVATPSLEQSTAVLSEPTKKVTDDEQKVVDINTLLKHGEEDISTSEIQEGIDKMFEENNRGAA